jgi:beta-lactamase class A
LGHVVAHQRISARLVLPAIAIIGVLAFAAVDVEANGRTVNASNASTPSPSVASATRVSPIAPIAVAPPDPSVLAAAVQLAIASSGAAVGVSLVELGGIDPLIWSANGGEVFTAASTYKLAALMLEAENIAAGRTDPNGVVCFQPDDYEAGWFDDYNDGACFTRTELAMRAGTYSDNTAGHMLVRDVGGADALNAWAASLGATNSVFFVDNTTTADDLAALWLAEARGTIGGAAAQAWLYPVLTGTRTEAGIPAGVPGGVIVVHKTGTIDLVDNDAALVTSGPDGPFVLVVMTDGLGAAAGWQLIATIAADVWKFEAERPLYA